jgi:hypothetical protein
MGIEAVAVLHIPVSSLKAVPFTVKAIEDAVLIHTTAELRDTDAIVTQLRAGLGDALDLHDDARGVLLFPSSYQPRATSYRALVDEIGDAGEWAPLATVEDIGAGGLEQLMGGVMRELGGDLSAIMQATMSGDPAAMGQMISRVQQAVEKSGGIDKVLAQLGTGDFLELQARAEQLVQNNPELAAQLGAVMGGEPGADEKKK